jgi:hypothetical protein
MIDGRAHAPALNGPPAESKPPGRVPETAEGPSPVSM